MDKLKFLIFGVLFIICINVCSAYFFQLNHSCEDSTCVSNNTIKFIFNLSNQANRELEITHIEVRENESDSLVVFHNETPVIVHNNFNRYLTLNATLTKTDVISFNKYYPCFRTVALRDNRYYRSEHGTELTYCYENYHMNVTVYPCRLNKDCDYDKICVNLSCEKVRCNYCQYITSHTCINYECCNTTQCAENQFCEDHWCTTLPCKENEIGINHSCVEFDCNGDEYIFNSTCTKIECPYYEYAVNHTCKTLKCEQDGFPSENQCEKLKCEDNEYGYNNACHKLNCSAISHPKGNKCRLDPIILLSLVSELVSWSVIIIVSLLIFKKYKIKHPPKSL